MRVLALALMFVAGTAVAEPFCKPDAAELAALPAAVAGDWQGALLQGVAVQDGKPRLLPEGGAPTPAKVTAAGAGLRYSDATAPEGIDLAASSAVENYALPGESPLLAEELLTPVMAAGGCSLADLPQFLGATPLAGGVSARFHAYVISGSEMLMVMQVGQVGPLAKPGNLAVRAVLRYTRAAQ